MTRPALCALLLTALLPACSDDAPTTLLDGPRVVAIVADPPVVAVDGTSRLTLVTALEGLPATPDRVSWRACSPAWLVVDPVRDCPADQAFALPLDEQGRAVVDVAAVATRFGVPIPPASDDPCGRAVIPLTIVVEAELTGARLIARKQVNVGVAPPPRTNPTFVQLVTSDGPLPDGATLAPGTTIQLSADIAIDSLDLVCEPDSDTPTRHEEVDVAVYAGGGAVASGLDFEILEVEGTTIYGAIDLTTPDAPAQVPLWLVAVDEGGGVAVRHTVLDVR